MPDRPHVSRITIYPIKALDGVAVEETKLLPAGPLEHDRRFAFMTQDGQFINGKRTPLIQRLRASFSSSLDAVTLRLEGQDIGLDFSLQEHDPELEKWLSAWFQAPVQVVENPATGFPDDLDSPGPTVVSTATLETVAAWFPPLSIDEVRRRFRANIEIAGVPAFWEDQLYGERGGIVRFQIGAAAFDGTNPCQRCPVPTRDSFTGEPIAGFAKTFAAKRQETLPSWAAKSRFDHFYRLTVNTCTVSGEGGKSIHVGDVVQVGQYT